MVTLVSPGVDVEIIDESYYGSAGPGTIPLIVMATAANKVASSGTGVAPFTVPSQAGKLFLATSQRELVQSFGNPTFYQLQGTPINGDELNEYGLHAAYSFLGISNRAYILRADIDLAQLLSSTTAPAGSPIPGTYWLNTSATNWGLFQSNGAALPGNAWLPQAVLVTGDGDVTSGFVPNPSFGTNGSYAVVPQTASNYFYEKIGGAWYQIGTSAWNVQNPTVVTGAIMSGTIPNTQTFSINGQTVGLTVNPSALADVVAAITTAAVPNITATAVAGALVITNTIGGNITVANVSGTPLTNLGITPGTLKGNTVTRTSNAAYPAGSVAGDIWIKGNPANNGANWSVNYFSSATSSFSLVTAPFYVFDSTKTDGDVTKDAAAIAALGNPIVGTVYVGYDITTGDQQLRRWAGLTTGWQSLVYEAQGTAPTTAPVAGTYWYNNANFLVDIMVSNGNQWIGYKHEYAATDPNGVLLSASPPTTQSNGTSALVTNDLWIDTSDQENYPALYRYDAVAMRWNLMDKTDHTTPFGIVFADARSNSGTTYGGIPNSGSYTFGSVLPSDMVMSDFLDPDAPDPELYPAGTLLFNTRYSTNNVKVWNPTYFNAGGYDPNTDFTQTAYNVGNLSYTFPAIATAGTWVTASGNDESGVAYMARKSQRIMVVRAMAAVIENNQDIRAEFAYYNLIAAPGYPELLSDMMTLNVDQKEVAFIVGDTPIRLTPDGTSIQAWATNSAGVASDGELGLVTNYTYSAVYYPWGLGEDASGNSVMVPPSTIALRTMAYNDQVAYPWFAPAGFQRGLVTNVTTVGYMDTSGDFIPVLLNNGQRDVLYSNRINPIAYIPNRGLVVYGQKTLSPLTTALDRINVARLCNYLKYNLDQIVIPYLFEQNDTITQTSAQHTVERFLNGLVGLQALGDYAVICDSSNNTPDRVDQNELWIDVLIQPLKAIEFIYIPVRILATGASMSLNVNTASAT